MTSVFTKIVRGDIPAHRVLEDDDHLAFLDIQPVQPGHTLVIPKQEIDHLFDLDEAAHAALWRFAHRVAKGLREATGARRIVVGVFGWEVPHAHIHLVPSDRMEDFPIPERLEVADDELAKIASNIQQRLESEEEGDEG